MKNFHHQEDNWKPCRPGTILGASDSQFRRQRRLLLIRSAMVGVLAGTGALTAIFVSRQKGSGLVRLASDTGKDETKREEFVDTKYLPITLSCSEIEELMGEYIQAIQMKEIKRSDDQRALIADFDEHLRVCSDCSKMVLNELNDA